MVHALNEARRAVKTDGLLVDLRPLLDRWPIELASARQQRQVGRATDLAEPLADDAAANAAMAESAASGHWMREQQEEFSLFYYWDTPAEMQEYILEDWYDVIHIEEPVWRDLKSAWASANADAR